MPEDVVFVGAGDLAAGDLGFAFASCWDFDFPVM
jgi:hypothetical protein